MAYAELHCHTNFSFLDGASPADELVTRAVALELGGLAITDHQGLYGAVRFADAAREAGVRPVIGVEVELLDAAAPDPAGVAVPARRGWRAGRRAEASRSAAAPAVDSVVADGAPARPRAARARLPGHRAATKEDLRGIGDAQRGPHLVLLARDDAGYRSLCRLVSRANLDGTKAMPRFTHALLGDHVDGLIALSGCRHGEIARRLAVGDRAGARAVAERYARAYGPSGFHLELGHHLLADDDWLVSETVALADELGLPVVVTNDVHYAERDGRELHDVLTAIRQGRSLDTLADLRRPDAESYLKSGRELATLPPGDGSLGERVATRWREGIEATAWIAASCSVDLGFERYRFPGFEVPAGETPFSHLAQLCHEGARRRYHPLTAAVVRQLAHELDVIERTGLAEFFLICWDLMRFAKLRGIPAQGRGSAADSIVAYVLGITRVDPIRHNLLFERFINEGRTSYPDVDIDFSSERREDVIQYVYERYGTEHTGMVCNVVTYRARSAVREVGYALGFPRPLVDRVAKALETYDSVMVRRDLEAEGGFGQFFARPGEEGVAVPALAAAVERTGERGLTDGMGQLNHARGGHYRTSGRTSEGRGEAAASHRPEDDERLARREDAARIDGEAPASRDSGRDVRSRLGGDIDDPNSGQPVAPRLLDTSRAASPPAGPTIRAARHDDDAAAMPPDLAIGHLMTEWGDRGGVERTAVETGLSPFAASGPSIRGGGRSDDKGGPGDSPASVRWLRADAQRRERHRDVPGNRTDLVHAPESAMHPPTSEAEPREAIGPRIELREAIGPRLERPPTVGPRMIDPESGVLLPAERTVDRLGRPYHWGPARDAPARDASGRDEAHSNVARVEPEPVLERHAGSTSGLSDWERWLEMCARLDGFPRHLSIHTGGMLITAAPLIDIAPLERATMPGRVVVQYDKRDVETIKLIKLDLLGLGMLAAIDETLQLIEHDCAVCLDLDRIPEEIPEVFAMLQAADTVGVFQVESRAQMQTLPKSRPSSLDDLVVEVAIIRPGPIQGNAVHPYLRRKQGLEPVTYLHPSLEPILGETLGVILYQEQVMKIAIEVAGFTAAGSDAFRRAMGTWRSNREMEKLHVAFVDGCIARGLGAEDAEELFRQCAAFASFGFAKSHAAAFARTAYESSFLKLFYPAQFVVGLINAQPMGFYPVEVLVNDAKRHGVTILPVDVNRSTYKTQTEWVGRPGWAVAGPAGDDGSHDGDPAEPLPEGVPARPRPVRSESCFVPGANARDRWAADSATGWGVRLGLRLVKGIGEEHAARLDAELARGPYTSLADVVERTGLGEDVIERLIRSGALDSLGQARRGLLWQLREVAGASRGRMDGRRLRSVDRAAKRAAGRPIDLRLPATDPPELPALTESERLGDAYAVIGLDGRRQVVDLFRPALDRLGAVANADLAARRPGPVRLGGLVVTRQHPMTARGTVFLALEDETGMVNVTLWPDTWARLRGIVRRHALLLVDGVLQREANVVNVVARDVRPLVEAANAAGGPMGPEGVRQLGWAGMRRMG